MSAPTDVDTLPRAGLVDRLERAVGWLRGAGLTAGDRFATVQGNDVAAFAVGWACALEGVVQVPVPPSASVSEARELLADADVHLVGVAPDVPGDVPATATSMGLRSRSLDLDVASPATPDAHWPRTRAMAYTSGTTGRRKGVHVGVHGADWGRAVLTDESAAFGDRHGARHLVVSPLYHSGPFRHALVTASGGGSVAVLRSFDVDAWLVALRALRPTSMFCVPTHLHRLLAHPELRRDDLASLELLVHAGAPCPVPLKHRLSELAPDGTVWEFYGSTEGQFTVCSPEVWAARPGTVGRARPGRRVTVRDDAGRQVAPGTIGTVWCEAPEHARWSYWRRPEATADAWRGAAFTVGDLGHLDEAGRLVLDGRPGDLVITGGVNVYPAEVERVLLRQDGVGEAAVFGVPDEEWGQRLVGAVVPSPGRAAPRPDELRAALRSVLSPARVPRQLLVVDDLPRTATGKVHRPSLPGLLDAAHTMTTTGEPA